MNQPSPAANVATFDARLQALATESPLEAAERRWHEALNRGAEPVVVLAAAEEVIHELKMALHRSVAA